MTIWICTPVFNRIEFTLRFLDSLSLQDFKNFKVVICDHGSSDGTFESVREKFPDVILIKGDNSLWWTGAINLCISYVLENAQTNDVVLTLNNDTELPSDYLAQLSRYHFKYPKAVITSVIHDIKTDNLVSVGYRQNWLKAKAIPVSFESDHIANDENIIQITHASGRGTLFPLAVFQELGLYDEVHLPHYAADYDMTHKARHAGYPIYVCKECIVLSHVDATGMTAIRNQLTLKNFIAYFTSIRSPANLTARWWLGWNNCPRLLFPYYIALDFLRIVGSYFIYHIKH